MEDTLTQIEASYAEAAVEAMDAFCGDIAGMLGIEASGSEVEVSTQTLKDLKKHAKKFGVTFSVESKGAANGNFHVFMDSAGLFVLAGTFVMLPEKIIVRNSKTGTEEAADELADAIGEVGNLMIGAWDKYFREEVDGHEHFLLTGTKIGKPWQKSEETLSLTQDQQLVVATYEIKIDSFDPFNCYVLFPKDIFNADAPTEEPSTEESVPADEPQPEAAEPQPVETDPAPEPEPVSQDTPAAPEKAEPAPEMSEQIQDPPATAEPQEQTTQPEPETPAVQEPAPETESPAETPQPAQKDNGPVSDVIQRMTHSSAVLPGPFDGQALSNVIASDVMRTDLAWATQDDTVEAVLAKMQQYNIGYALVGDADSLQGIVSKSDINGALSPYLQSVFSKWCRELDTATLQIKVKWIMSRPVRTIRPDASLAAIMQTMTKHAVRALPVADEKQGVHGIVTVYSIFNAMLTDEWAFDGAAAQSSDIPPMA